MRKCEEKTIEGKSCQNYIIQGYNHCRNHLTKEELINYKRQKLLSKNDLILVLQRSLNRVKNASTIDPIEQSKALIGLSRAIVDLGGSIVGEKDAFQDKLKRWEAENK